MFSSHQHLLSLAVPNCCRWVLLAESAALLRWVPTAVCGWGSQRSNAVTCWLPNHELLITERDMIRWARRRRSPCLIDQSSKAALQLHHLAALHFAA